MEGVIVREGKSKTGMPYRIRYPKDGDAPGACDYINRLSQERTYVRLQGEEVTLEREEEVVANWRKKVEQKESVVLFLIVDERIQGICTLEMDDRTESHIGNIALSVAQELRGQGLGEIILRTVMEEAVKEIPRLELFVLSAKEPNETAISLYKKLGFVQHGYLPGGTTHDGRRVGMVLMHKNV